MASATTVPARAPRLTKLMAMMIAMACHSEVVKSLIASSTVTDWSATSTGSMPMGRSAVSSAMRRRMFSPSASTSP